MPTRRSAAFFCSSSRQIAGFLLGAVIEVLAVQPQHLQRDVLAHRIGHVGVDEADDRHVATAGPDRAGCDRPRRPRRGSTSGSAATPEGRARDARRAHSRYRRGRRSPARSALRARASSRASCGFQRASESTEERNSSAIIIPSARSRALVSSDSKITATLPHSGPLPRARRRRHHQRRGEVDALAVEDAGLAMARRRRLGSAGRRLDRSRIAGLGEHVQPATAAFRRSPRAGGISSGDDVPDLWQRLGARNRVGRGFAPGHAAAIILADRTRDAGGREAD